MRMRTPLLPALVAFAVTVACSGSGTSNSTPTPTPTTTPNECLISFQTSVSPSAANLYTILMPASQWSNGVKTLTLGANGGDATVDAIYSYFGYLGDLSGTNPTYVATGAATAGSFTLSGISSDAAGSGFSWSDTSVLAFYDILQNGAGTGLQDASNGEGSIASGTLSNPAYFASASPTVTPTLFSGSVTLSVHSATVETTLTIGQSNLELAGCFDNPSAAFDPASPPAFVTRLFTPGAHQP
jgi:hypothetical protein